MSSNPKVKKFLDQQTPEARKRWETNPMMENIIQSWINNWIYNRGTVKPQQPNKSVKPDPDDIVIPDDPSTDDSSSEPLFPDLF